MKSDSKDMLKAKIALLMGARVRVEQGVNYPICYAIADAQQPPPYRTPEERRGFTARIALTGYIGRVLGRHSYYPRWLYEKQTGMRPGLSDYPAWMKNNREGVKQGRLAWIDWMIKCLQEDLKAKAKAKEKKK